MFSCLYQVLFGKSTFWKKTIEARAISDNRAKWEKWVGMAKAFLDSRDRDDAVNCTSKSSVVPSTCLKQTALQETSGKDRGAVARHRSRGNLGHNHRGVAGAILPYGPLVCTAAAKVFPWILVSILLMTILHLHTAFSNVEQSLLENTRLIVNLQKQLASLQAGTCPMTA